MLTIGRSGVPASQPERVNALGESNDACVVCHNRTTPGLVKQYGHSTMATTKVSCRDYHEVKADHPGAVEHEDSAYELCKSLDNVPSFCYI